MHLFVAHNAYIDRGGEDICVANEVKALREAGIRVTLWESQNKQSLSSLSKAAAAPWGGGEEKRLEEALEQEKPDLLHVHNLYPLLSPRVFLMAQRLNIRTVQTLHNYRPLCLNGLFLTPAKQLCEQCAGGNYWPGIVRGCYRGSRLQSAGLATHLLMAKHSGAYDSVDQFIAPSAFLKAKYVSYGFPERKIVVQNHFLSEVSQEAPVAPEPYLLYLSRLSEEKGVRWLIQNFKNCTLPLRLVLAGDGPLRNEVETSVNGTSIEYAGYVTGEKKRQLLQQATALVVPSECYENFPLSVLEANALGTPAIVSDLGGLQDIVQPTINGERYRSNDADSFKSVVRRIFEAKDPMRLRMNAQQHARSKYSQEQFLERRLSIYRTLVSSGRIKKDLPIAGRTGNSAKVTS